VIEIFGGQTDWDQQKVTYGNFIKGKPYAEIFNTQMIYDKELSDRPGSKNFITISQPVMQRLLNGTTKGLLIRPLGAITASFTRWKTRKDNWDQSCILIPQENNRCLPDPERGRMVEQNEFDVRHSTNKGHNEISNKESRRKQHLTIVTFPEEYKDSSHLFII
jgi:hypothetical protein